MRIKSRDISKKQKVLNYLLRYGSIDRMTAVTHAKSFNIAKQVFELKQDGNDVRYDRSKEKYILFDKVTGEPVFSRFIKQKAK